MIPANHPPLAARRPFRAMECRSERTERDRAQNRSLSVRRAYYQVLAKRPVSNAGAVDPNSNGSAFRDVVQLEMRHASVCIGAPAYLRPARQAVNPSDIKYRRTPIFYSNRDDSRCEGRRCTWAAPPRTNRHTSTRPNRVFPSRLIFLYSDLLARSMSVLESTSRTATCLWILRTRQLHSDWTVPIRSAVSHPRPSDRPQRESLVTCRSRR